MPNGKWLWMRQHEGITNLALSTSGNQKTLFSKSKKILENIQPFFYEKIDCEANKEERSLQWCNLQAKPFSLHSYEKECGSKGFLHYSFFGGKKSHTTVLTFLEGMVAEMWEMQQCMNDAAAHLVCKNKITFYGLLMFPYSNPSMNTTSNSRTEKPSGYKIKIANCGEGSCIISSPI